MTLNPNLLLYISIFLIGTPALSISYVTGFPLGANDKLGLIFLLMYIFFTRIRISFEYFKYFVFVSFLFFINILIVPSRLDSINQSYGYIIAPILLGLLFEVARLASPILKKVLWSYMIANIVVYLIQILLPLLIGIDTAPFFIQNKIQGSYSFPLVAEGIRRVPGLFNESSQVSILFALLPLFRSTPLAWFISFILVLSTFSNSGFAVWIINFLFLVILPCAYSLKIRKRLSIFLIPISALLSLYFDQILFIFNSILNRFWKFFLFSSEYNVSARSSIFLFYLDKIDLFGHGFYTDQPRFDFYTLYFYGFGFILAAIFTLMFLIIFVKYHFRLIHFCIIIIVFATNASILGGLVPLVLAILSINSLSLSSARISNA